MFLAHAIFTAGCFVFALLFYYDNTTALTRLVDKGVLPWWFGLMGKAVVCFMVAVALVTLAVGFVPRTSPLFARWEEGLVIVLNRGATCAFLAWAWLFHRLLMRSRGRT